MRWNSVAVLLALGAAAAAGDRATLEFSTLVGGRTHDGVAAVATGRDGSLYVAGTTRSRDFPVTPGAFQTRYNGDRGFTSLAGDAFVMKLDARTLAPVYSTFLGGSQNEEAVALAVDDAGNAWVAGVTYSPDFPRTDGAWGSAGGRVFVAKLNPAGSGLVWSATFAGAATWPRALAVDRAGGVWVAGDTGDADFPVTPGALQQALAPGWGSSFTSTDAFLTRLDPSGARAVFSTYLGGYGADSALAVAVDGEGNAWVGGAAGSGFPVTANAMRAENGYSGGFLARVDGGGARLLYSSYLPGAHPRALALDAGGSLYVAGRAEPGAALTPGLFQSQIVRGSGYVAKLTPDGTAFAWSTVLGGLACCGDAVFHALSLDAGGGVWVGGETRALDYPVFGSALPSCNRGTLLNEYGVVEPAAVLAAFDAEGRLRTSSYFGGCRRQQILALSPAGAGRAWIAGSTDSTEFPSIGSRLPSLYAGESYTGFVGRVGLTGDPRPEIARIEDTASRWWGVLAPGQLVTIRGSGLGPAAGVEGRFVNGALAAEAAGTTITFDGAPAPLLYVSDTLVRAIVPFSAGNWFGWGSLRKRTLIRVRRGTSESVLWGEYFLDRLPSFFTADGSGEGAALAVHADGSPVSPERPARRGSVVTFYVSGAGRMDPSPRDGERLADPAPRIAPRFASVWFGTMMGGAAGLIEYIGGVAGQVAGLTQLNVRIPADAPVDIEVPVTLRLDDHKTQLGVFLAIE